MIYSTLETHSSEVQRQISTILSFSLSENMASFEVDMLLSEVPLGDKIQLTIQYNPSG